MLVPNHAQLRRLAGRSYIRLDIGAGANVGGRHRRVAAAPLCLSQNTRRGVRRDRCGHPDQREFQASSPEATEARTSFSAASEERTGPKAVQDADVQRERPADQTARVCCSFLLKEPYIDRSRVGVFGKVRAGASHGRPSRRPLALKGFCLVSGVRRLRHQPAGQRRRLAGQVRRRPLPHRRF